MTLLFMLVSLLIFPCQDLNNNVLLIDDFNNKSGLSTLGTSWFSLADTVMGGVSEGRAKYEDIEKESCLRLTGQVSLENNGGFIQVALRLARRGTLDASRFDGVRIRARGNGEKYYLHIRTTQSSAPWKYFAAEFKTSAKWETIDIPFSDFVFEGGRGELDKSNLIRIAIVAAKKAFAADVSVSRMEFYRVTQKPSLMTAE